MKSHEEVKWWCFNHQHRQNVAFEGTTTPWEFKSQSAWKLAGPQQEAGSSCNPILFQGQTVIPQGCNIYPTLGKPEKHHFQKYLWALDAGHFFSRVAWCFLHNSTTKACKNRKFEICYISTNIAICFRGSLWNARACVACWANCRTLRLVVNWLRGAGGKGCWLVATSQMVTPAAHRSPSSR